MKTLKITKNAPLIMVFLLLFTQQAFAPPPIHIATATDLLNISPADYGKNFVLDNDIDLGCPSLTTAVIAPDISNTGIYYDGNPFTGTFDGQDYCIYGLCIDTLGADNDYLGLFGMIAAGAEVKNLCVDVSITGGNLSAHIGALAGETTDTSIIENCSSSGDLTIGGSFTSHTSAIGGLIGWNGGDIYDSYSTCIVNTGREPWYVGGLAGYNGGEISCSYAVGDVNTGTDGYAGHYVGGLIGYNSSGESLVSSCYATGNVTGYTCVGGLVGTNYFSEIKDCYAKGSVTADYGSGLVHEIFYCSITNCYSTGWISGTYDDSSGCIGAVSGGPVYVTSCFWDIETSGMTQSYLGTGKTTTQMQTESTFTSAGWDFTDIWVLVEEGATYPELACQPETECSALHVLSIEMELLQGGPAGPAGNKALATITVVDCFGMPVEGAHVSTRWTGIVDPFEEYADDTDSDGQVTFKVKDGDPGYFIVTIFDVYLSGWTWDEDASVTTESLLNY